MKYLTLSEQLRIERQKNESLAAENAKLKADVDYIAMMSNVELENETEEAKTNEQ